MYFIFYTRLYYHYHYNISTSYVIEVYDIIRVCIVYNFTMVILLQKKNGWNIFLNNNFGMHLIC